MDFSAGSSTCRSFIRLVVHVSFVYSIDVRHRCLRYTGVVGSCAQALVVRGFKQCRTKAARIYQRCGVDMNGRHYLRASLERQLGQFLISRNVKVMTPAAMRKGSIIQKDKKASPKASSPGGAKRFIQGSAATRKGSIIQKDNKFAKASPLGAAKRLQGRAALRSQGPRAMGKRSIVQRGKKASANASPPGGVEWLRIKKLRQAREQRALLLERQKLRGVSHA